jgi:hypothetical protein
MLLLDKVNQDPRVNGAAIADPDNESATPVLATPAVFATPIAVQNAVAIGVAAAAATYAVANG